MHIFVSCFEVSASSFIRDLGTRTFIILDVIWTCQFLPRWPLLTVERILGRSNSSNRRMLYDVLYNIDLCGAIYNVYNPTRCTICNLYVQTQSLNHKLNSGCRHDALYSIDFLHFDTIFKNSFKGIYGHSYFYNINFDIHRSDNVSEILLKLF